MGARRQLRGGQTAAGLADGLGEAMASQEASTRSSPGPALVLLSSRLLPDFFQTSEVAPSSRLPAGVLLWRATGCDLALLYGTIRLAWAVLSLASLLRLAALLGPEDLRAVSVVAVTTSLATPLELAWAQEWAARVRR